MKSLDYAAGGGGGILAKKREVSEKLAVWPNGFIDLAFAEKDSCIKCAGTP